MKKLNITESEKKNILGLYNLLKEDVSTAQVIKDALQTSARDTILGSANQLLAHENVNNIIVDKTFDIDINDNFKLTLTLKMRLYGGKVNRLFASKPPYTLGLDVGMSSDVRLYAKLTWNGYSSGEIFSIVEIDPKSTDTYALIPAGTKFSVTSLIGIEVMDGGGKNPLYIFKPTISNVKLTTSKINVPNTYWTFSMNNSIIDINFGTIFGVKVGSFSYDLNPIINQQLTQLKGWIEIPKADLEKAKTGQLKTSNFKNYIKTGEFLTMPARPKK